MSLLNQTHAVIEDEWKPVVPNAVELEGIRSQDQLHA